ncbi:MAG: GNAT family N-acetyltransferase [Flavobacteriaceae bacterium]|nr:GNAT family N-acetyltransferase [Flavobacteriaceae bacterium]|tara:strand:+ start:10528 stop:10998 length:471 start_codon:yes stop_codon:yes gene_type:complete
MTKYEIINFKIEHEKHFYDLNIAWLKEFFLVEDYDQKILSNPQKHIINKGGSIFFAKKNKKIIGVVALMPTDKLDVFELTKMGVKKSFRNQGVGRLLINKCIEKVKLDKLKKVIIYSNRKLENAIYLYKSFGFTEVELEKKSNYQRADIKLELRLK